MSIALELPPLVDLMAIGAVWCLVCFWCAWRLR